MASDLGPVRMSGEDLGFNDTSSPGVELRRPNECGPSACDSARALLAPRDVKSRLPRNRSGLRIQSRRNRAEESLPWKCLLCRKELLVRPVGPRCEQRGAPRSARCLIVKLARRQVRGRIKEIDEEGYRKRFKVGNRASNLVADRIIAWAVKENQPAEHWVAVLDNRLHPNDDEAPYCLSSRISAQHLQRRRLIGDFSCQHTKETTWYLSDCGGSWVLTSGCATIMLQDMSAGSVWS